MFCAESYETRTLMDVRNGQVALVLHRTSGRESQDADSDLFTLRKQVFDNRSVANNHDWSSCCRVVFLLVIDAEGVIE